MLGSIVPVQRLRYLWPDEPSNCTLPFFSVMKLLGRTALRLGYGIRLPFSLHLIFLVFLALIRIPIRIFSVCGSVAFEVETSQDFYVR
jgi:hypothetical protein